jgi:adenine-specific DNA-methyltransferase
VIKYLGSKRLLLDAIVKAVGRHPSATTVLDLFSGTSRVGHALKAAGYRVLANDHNEYAHVLARCYVAADRERWADEAQRHLDELGALEGEAGWFTRTFCEDARYLHPKNGARVEAIRNEIARRALDPELEAILLTSLMEAADRVDSTVGVQMAYLKEWAPRAHNDLALRLPDLLPRARGGAGLAHRLDALDAARSLAADVAYVDPPYNQHSYLGNYHLWETLCAWDAPEVYGVARKRVDVKTRKSDFNSKRRFSAAFKDVVDAIDAALIVVSFNDEGYLDREEALEVLSTRGEVSVVEHDYKRYVGSQIGIYNPDGEKVGRPGKKRNKERLFVVKTPGLGRLREAS